MTDCQWIAAMSNAFGQVDQFSKPIAKMGEKVRYIHATRATFIHYTST